MKEFQLKFITNKKTARMLVLASYIEHNSTVTLKYLAKLTNSSDRTILSDLNFFHDYFESTINSISSNKGYTFAIQDKVRFVELKRNLLKDEPLFKIIESIFHNRCKSLVDWSDFLFITESTLKRYLVRVKPILDMYSISFVFENKVDFKGLEINIRQFFHDFYYESDITPHTVFVPLSIQEIALKIQKDQFFSEYSYTSFTDFSYTLYITLERFSNGKPLMSLPKKAKFLLDIIQEHKKAVDIKEARGLIKEFFRIEINDFERIYIYLMLMTNRTVLKDVSVERAFITKFEPYFENNSEAINACLKIASPPKQYHSTTKVLITAFFVNIYLRSSLSNILNQNIQDITLYTESTYATEFQEYYEVVKNNLQSSLMINNRQVTDITTSLCLFINSIKVARWSVKKNVIFLIEGNQYFADNFRAKLINAWGGDHNLLFPDVNDITKDYWIDNDVDLLVTNYGEYLNDDIGSIKSILLDMIPSEENWNYLKSVLS